MKILLVDDHVIVRQGLKQILADEYPAARFCEAGTVSEALQQVRKEPWDIMLLDLTLPGRGGLDALGEFKEAQPRLPILVLSMHPEADFAVRVLKAGASGYLTKQSAAEELLGAIKKALAGGRYVTASLAERLAADLAGHSAVNPHEDLSPREYQTLLLLAGGKSVKEIGATIGISGKTVSTYRARILEKLRLKSNVELARYAIQHRLIE